ncbi:antibiotic biosynthesis monooxygenase family protein [Thalassotalea marina]|uniref:Antibiotic biosynthesis monooxygenase n=1 Tax=Thalassotalea marina TaxID=1673741 RepID=A0A919BGH1_9GAMM|nr:antibiotic biosynthesis monooxygenase [Thalassotalea marina]GHF89710.1 antibiotic biosynthesis monooxygenase [Thalassotalea marina]
MIAVIFEVSPKADTKAQYLELARELRPLLNDIEGFISIERFQSLNDDNKLLSLSYWQDEAAIEHWRNNVLHQEAQYKGKSALFADFSIKVASITRQYAMHSTIE